MSGSAAVWDARPLVRGPLRAWLAPGTDLGGALPRDGDPDRLLTRPDCRIVKLQPKVIVGRIETAAGALYVKRYNIFAWRIALGSLVRRSPVARALAGARALTAAGFAIPDIVAAVEYRRAGVLVRSFFVTREVPDAVTADARWRAILAEPDAGRRRRARRALARGLGELFRRLHAAGLYHADLKDVNVLVRGPLEAPTFVLLDLECVHALGRVPQRRQVKNLVQLARTLGRASGATDRLRFLEAYLGPDAGAGERRRWARLVAAQTARKDRGRVSRARGRAVPRVSCTVVCQDEEAGIAPCLDSLRWADEIVVVDGGSRDGTVDIARRFTDRVLLNRWPGYRAQKQFALDATTGEWVLNVDADERVTPELAAEIRTVLGMVPDSVDGFAMPRLVCYLGRWWFRGDWYPRPVVRLVRRVRTRWGGFDPHDRAEVEGAVLQLRWPLLHYTYEDVAGHLRSANHLTSVAATQERVPTQVGATRLVFEPVWRFVRGYIVRRGALDGFPGLWVSATGAFYAFLRWAKVWERRRRETRASLDPPPVGP